MKGYDGFFKKWFQMACFDHQTLQSRLKTRTNRCQFSVGTPALFLEHSMFDSELQPGDLASLSAAPVLQNYSFM